LEQHQLIERTVVPTVPVQISYTPTQRGLSLVRAMLPLAAWALDEANLVDQFDTECTAS
jgi:DNA-binding HxlR family transcriptional regulator